MEISKGSLVYSRAGKDKGKLFLVTGLEDGYVYYADGKTRQVKKPKKKKIIHINKTNTVLEIGENITDIDVRKALSKYSNLSWEEE